MNYKDKLLIGIVFIIALVAIILLQLLNEDATKAEIYYDGVLVKEISLLENKTYEVMGANGVVIIVVENKKIKVKQEESPLHLCSKQGFISKKGESIICLPNKIVISLGNDDKYDAIIK